MDSEMYNALMEIRDALREVEAAVRMVAKVLADKAAAADAQEDR